eukprot:11194792-Lingulodinium_polyedra.AAC.1
MRPTRKLVPQILAEARKRSPPGPAVRPARRSNSRRPHAPSQPWLRLQRSALRALPCMGSATGQPA